jgi:lipopolysaccharide biosynthesis protein
MVEYKKYATENSRKNLKKFKFTHKRRHLNIWENEIKEIIKKIKIADSIWLYMKPFQDKINYERLLAIEKINREMKKAFTGKIYITDTYILEKP